MTTDEAGRRADGKAADAFRTISEVAAELDLPQHVLRFWETRFGQIKPMKRGGGRRYYRPEDVALLAGIRTLLYADGMTIRGVQRLLKEKGVAHVSGVADPAAKAPAGRGRSASFATVTAAEEDAKGPTSAADPFFFDALEPDPAEVEGVTPLEDAEWSPSGSARVSLHREEDDGPTRAGLSASPVRAPDPRPAPLARSDAPIRAVPTGAGSSASVPAGLPAETQRRLRSALAELDEAKRLLDSAL